MTQKHLERNKVFLSELRQRTVKRGINAGYQLLHGRGRCLVDESVLKKPMHERPVCSVFEIIARYLALPPRIGGPNNAWHATPEARKAVASMLTDRFSIRRKTTDGKITTREELIDSFVNHMELVFSTAAQREVLGRHASQVCARVEHRLCSAGKRNSFGWHQYIAYGTFSDIHNLSRKLTPEDIANLRLKDSVRAMLRENLALDLLLSRTRVSSDAEEALIATANAFALGQLELAGVISCRQCKKGKELAVSKSDGGIFWWRGRKNQFVLREDPEEPLTGCPTKGFRPGYNSGGHENHGL